VSTDELEGRLGELLSAEVRDVRRLTGGASRETWSFSADGRRYVLQRERPGAVRAGAMEAEAALLRAASAAGVPVAPVVLSGTDDPVLGTGYLVSAFVEGESIARRILRDDAYAGARSVLAEQCGTALAQIHSIPPAGLGLEGLDELRRYREVLDGFGDGVPAFELAFRWLGDNRPGGTGEAVVHGDFRLGNLLIGPDGLRAVVDWELAHVGDPMEDLGWLCVRAWRFGGDPPVAGVGSYQQLFDAYGSAAGTSVDAGVVRWWEVLGTLKWGIMCIMQARAHLDGLSRSVELAAIGRRVCENEHDLLLLLAPEALDAARRRPSAARSSGPVQGTTRPGGDRAARPSGMHGRPTAAELVEAVKEYVEDDVRPATEGRVAFHSRVAANVLATVQRELEVGPAMAVAHRTRLDGIGVADEGELAAGIRDGRFDDRAGAVTTAVAETVIDKVLVANPGYLRPISTK
jgi:aminoglycoside phosphotransferase (APT) family kinase protein